MALAIASALVAFFLVDANVRNLRGEGQEVTGNTSSRLLEEQVACSSFDLWPDIDNGVTCGGCKALVRSSQYGGRCDRYCESFGHTCIAAAEEEHDGCGEKYAASCSSPIEGTSDILCTCKTPPTTCAPFSDWPDVDSGRTCGQCQALVLTAQYESRCDKYCESFGHTCIGAAEEKDDSCEVLYPVPCSTPVARTSDMLCKCQKPGSGSTTTTTAAPAGGEPACLCVFDIDRTLTGKQGDSSNCPDNLVLRGIHDDGYGGGEATLSALSHAGISSTFCGECYVGICSAGYGSGEGSVWNNYILDYTMRTGPQDTLTDADPSIKRWSYGTNVISPYVLGQGNKVKQDAVEGIRKWFEGRGIPVAASDVYFFGDRTENIPPFVHYGLNSREISCQSRDYHLYGGSGLVGYCGATPEEVQKVQGNLVCADVTTTTTTAPISGEPACLCVFDIDRTLTGKQGDSSNCPNNLVLRGIHDDGYGGGEATLSALSHAGMSSTFCGECYVGICSAGYGSGEGSVWNNYILDYIMRTDLQDALTNADPSVKRWSYGTNVISPYVLGQGNKVKQDAVEGIRKWFEGRGIPMAASDVYFFGDRTENIPPFVHYGLNSREISCQSRDYHLYGGSGLVGYCGATPEEVQKVQGNLVCDR